ncbi:MAG TPA: apolipoprotein N-acyltransferase, partial [Spirochaetia bacterium]|nr:apolipoprotein N-acyltransferase [Spirochaetia bacterium]
DEIRPGERSVAVGLEHVLLIMAAALLFALSFPNFLFPWGFGFLGFAALIPLFPVIHRARWWSVWAYGLLFAVGGFALHNYWLALFHPVALTVVLAFRGPWFALLFPLLKLADREFPRYGFLIQALLWTGWEFIGVQGFLGYSFGGLGYSQYLFLPLLQLASLTAVWGISCMVILPSAYVGNLLKNGRKGIRPFFRNTRGAAIGYAVLLTVVLVWGGAVRALPEGISKLTVAAVQPNSDPWKGGTPVYEENLTTLMALSRKALLKDPQLLIWPETAVVPSLRLHSRMRYDQERYNRIVRPFFSFAAELNVPLLTGNNDRELAGRDARGGYLTDDYNAAVLLQGGEISAVYRKTHLVPFTEYFPYRDLFPGIYQWLLTEDTHFYTPGEDLNKDLVFSIPGARFSALICFEDTFPAGPRRFTRAGAELLVNLTNDAWSESVVAEMQHFSLSVLRSVENRRSLVRATISGITALIGPDGSILERIPPFGEDYLVGEVPLSRETTLAAAWGDWFAIAALCAAGAALLAGFIIRVLKMRVKGN